MCGNCAWRLRVAIVRKRTAFPTISCGPWSAGAARAVACRPWRRATPRNRIRSLRWQYLQNAPSAYDSIGFNVYTFRLLHVDAAWPLPTQELQCGGAGRSMHRQFRACRALQQPAHVSPGMTHSPCLAVTFARWLGATPTPYTYTLVILRLRIRQRRIHRQVLVAEEARHIAGELAPLLARHEILREQPAALLRRQSPKITRSPVRVERLGERPWRRVPLEYVGDHLG